MPISTEVPQLNVTLDGPRATISIDRANRRNALNFSMWRALPGLISRIEATPDVRLIVITGIGPDFSAGADISEFEELRATPDGAKRYDATTELAYDAIRKSKLPSIAAVRGACIGGGFGLAMACDIRVAQSDAIFAIPAARLGLAYPVNSLAHITSIIGPALAKDMLFTARRLSATEALNGGILSGIAPRDVDEIVGKYAHQIAMNAPLSLRAAKAAIDAFAEYGNDLDPDTMCAVHARADACFESDDYAEGRGAFIDKRQPVFRGQ